MFEKLKGKKRDGQDLPEGNEGKEKSEPLSGAAKYLVIGLGTLFIMGGVGFMVMQTLSGGSQQQAMNQQTGQAPEQKQETNEKLRELKQKKEEPPQDSGGSEIPAGALDSDSDSFGDDAEAEDIFREVEDKTEQQERQADEDREIAKETEGFAGQDEDAEADRGRDKVLDRLDSIEESLEASVDDGMKKMTAEIEKLGREVERNGDRVESLNERVSEVAEASGQNSAVPKEHANLILKKRELEDQVASLTDRVNDFKGRYKWVRKLERKKKEELEQSRQELEEVRKKYEQASSRPVFGKWKLAGVSDNEVVLVEDCSSEVKRIKLGESFQGIEIEEIDAANGKVHTSAGVEKLS